MSTTTLAAPIRVNTAGVHARPGLGRLVAVELRKMVDTRAGFWLQVAMVALTVVVVVVRLLVGDAAHHTFQSVLDAGLQPAAILLPVLGILLVTSEWSQRTGLITFALVPVRSRVLGAKLIASLLRAVAMLAMSVAVVAAGVLVSSPGVEGTWSDAAPLIGQSAVNLTTGMVVGVAFGAILLASTPAIVLLFALPTSWMALVSLPVFSGVAPWVDNARALGQMTEEVMSATQWAHAGTSLAIWMMLPLLIGAWREVFEPVVRVEARRVWKHPSGRGLKLFFLASDGGLRAVEGHAIARDTQKSDVRRTCAPDEAAERRDAGPELVITQLVGPCGGTRHQVGDAETGGDDRAGLARMNPPIGEARLVQSAPQPVPRPGEMRAGPTRIERRVDPHQQHPHPRSHQVRNRGATRGLEVRALRPTRLRGPLRVTDLSHVGR